MSLRRSTMYLVALASVAAGTAIAVAVVLAGGSASGSSIRQEKARALASAASRPTVASVVKASEHFAKPAPRDPAFAKFSDPEYGVSFSYPRVFALLASGDEDGDADRLVSWQQAKEKGAGVRTAEELAGDDPGAALLATIVIPDDAYPNTSFAGGSVQFAMNRYQTAGTCQPNLLARVGDAKAPSGKVTARGITFGFIDIDAGDGNTEYYERDYAGFANGSCYEFFVRVGVAATVTQPSPQNVSTADESADAGLGLTNGESAGYRPPNERKIFGQLEKIVVSLQVEPVAGSSLDKPKYKAEPAFQHPTEALFLRARAPAGRLAVAGRGRYAGTSLIGEDLPRLRTKIGFDRARQACPSITLGV
jgi:hypothetical protein